MVLVHEKRRLERRLRWIIFLVFSAGWSFAVWHQGISLVLTGIVLLGAALLQAWNRSRIPVLAYHSVSDNASWLTRPDLTIPSASFRRQMQWLKRHGFSTLTMEELWSHRNYGTDPNNFIVLTFDDGYLDNWVAVEPILREAGLCGTIFISTDWIEDGQQCRPQSGQVPDHELSWAGYLNPAEIRAMAERGVLDVQSHGASHDLVFCNDRISGFTSSDDQPQWLALLLNEKKPAWYKQPMRLPAGYPLFPNGNALAVSAFYPDPNLVDKLTAAPADSSVINDADRQQRLREAADSFEADHGSLGHMETKAETHNRWRKELEDSKQTLERISEKEVAHLCWPRDAYCKESQQIAFSVGYHSVTAHDGLNSDHNPNMVSRVYIDGCGIPWLDITAFVLHIWVFRGRIWAWPALVLASTAIQLLWRRKK
ncbi:MAG: polysaccharide deacetylase family protein [Gammaproteobacteria bacterium]